MTPEQEGLLRDILAELKEISSTLKSQAKMVRAVDAKNKEKMKSALVEVVNSLPPGMKAMMAPLMEKIE